MDIKQAAKRLITLVRRGYWCFRVRRKSAVCGNGLKANFATYVTRNTFLGENINFNGMRMGLS